MQRRIALATAAMAAAVGLSTCIAVSATTGADLFGLHTATNPATTVPAARTTVPSADELAVADGAADPAADATDAAPDPVYIRVREYYNQIVQVRTGAAQPTETAPTRIVIRSASGEQLSGDLVPIADDVPTVNAADAPANAAPANAAPAAGQAPTPTPVSVAVSDESTAPRSSSSSPAPSATEGASTTSQGASPASSTTSGGTHPTSAHPTSTRATSTAGSTTIPAGIPPDSTIPRSWPIGKPLPPLPTAPTTCALWRLSMKGVWSCLATGEPAPVTTVRAAEHRREMLVPTSMYTLSDGRVVAVPADTSDD
jgi:hypothetical protein